MVAPSTEMRDRRVGLELAKHKEPLQSKRPLVQKTVGQALGLRVPLGRAIPMLWNLRKAGRPCPTKSMCFHRLLCSIKPLRLAGVRLGSSRKIP
jgi:hypothetical protein